MLPTAFTEDLQEDFAVETPPSRTYQIRFDGKPSTGMIDGLAAMEQAIYLRLRTERFRFPIFSWDYGTETEDWIGESDPDLLQIDIESKITDSLMADDRILQVTDFTFAKEKGVVKVSFTVKTIFGDLQEEMEVADSVG